MMERSLDPIIPARKENIAFLLPNLHGGGSQRAQLLIAQGAAELGEAVDVVVCRRVGHFVEDVPKEVRLIDLKGWSDYSPLAALIHYLQTERPTVIFSALNPANLLSLLAVRLARVETRVIMSVHTPFYAKWKQEFTPTAPLRKSLFKWMYRNADGVIAVSGGLRDSLVGQLGLAKEKVVAIANPVDLNRVREMSRDDVSHCWLDKDRTVPVAISVGRLSKGKDFATLLRAFKRVIKEQAARLLILGEGPERQRLEGIIRELGLSEVVEIVGFQANPYAWMAKADLFVSSSLFEGFGLALVEALALDMPIVSTDCDFGPREILSASSRSRLAAPGNPSDLARQILAVLQISEKTNVSPAWALKVTPLSAARQYLGHYSVISNAVAAD